MCSMFSKDNFISQSFKSLLTLSTQSFLTGYSFWAYNTCLIKEFDPCFRIYCKKINFLFFIIYLMGSHPSSKYNISFAVVAEVPKFFLMRLSSIISISTNSALVTFTHASELVIMLPNKIEFLNVVAVLK